MLLEGEFGLLRALEAIQRDRLRPRNAVPDFDKKKFFAFFPSNCYREKLLIPRARCD